MVRLDRTIFGGIAPQRMAEYSGTMTTPREAPNRHDLSQC
jgi:hypothetical protein